MLSARVGALGAVLLLVTLASAAMPYGENGEKPSAGITIEASTTGASNFKMDSVTTAARRAVGKANKSRRGVSGSSFDSVTTAARKAVEKAKSSLVARMQEGDNKVQLRKSVKNQISKSQSMASLRQSFKQSGVEQAAVMLRRKKDRSDSLSDKADLRAWTEVTQNLKANFIAYDDVNGTRRAQLQLPRNQGTASEQQKCRELGWAVVGLYMDMKTGEDVSHMLCSQ
jgi:flavin-binding protein dodecin